MIIQNDYFVDCLLCRKEIPNANEVGFCYFDYEQSKGDYRIIMEIYVLKVILTKREKEIEKCYMRAMLAYRTVLFN